MKQGICPASTVAAAEVIVLLLLSGFVPQLFAALLGELCDSTRVVD